MVVGAYSRAERPAPLHLHGTRDGRSGMVTVSCVQLSVMARAMARAVYGQAWHQERWS